MKISAKISEQKTEKRHRKIHENKTYFFTKMNKIHKLLAWQIKEKREKIRITNNGNEKWGITTDLTNTERIIKRKKQLYTSQFDNLDETDQLLKRHKLPKLTYNNFTHQWSCIISCFWWVRNLDRHVEDALSLFHNVWSLSWRIWRLGGWNHLKARLGQENLPSRWFTHMTDSWCCQAASSPRGPLHKVAWVLY